jgi:DNA modification methylase
MSEASLTTLKDQHFQWLALDAIRPWDRNPRKNDPAVPRVASSIRRFGFIAPVVVWASAGRLVAGHTRLKALRRLLADDPGFLPRGAPAAGLVPVRFAEFASEAEADAYALADNRLNEIATWDSGALGLILAELQKVDAALVEDIGFSAQELAKLMPSDPTGEADEPTDPTEGLRKKWQTEEGQLWLIPSRSTAGRAHRILCGDSTNPQHVERLRGGDRWLLMVTDPPYGVEYDPSWRDDINHCSTKLSGKVLNDDVADWTPVWVMWEPQTAYVWHAAIHSGIVADSLDNAGLVRRSQIIWRKQHFQLSRGDYHWQHEPCWYAVRKGAKSGWCGDRTQSTIWDIINLNPRGGGGKGEDAPVGHGTQKPVECMARPIRNHFEPGGIVCDPFHGSGTTLIAAERERRICYAMELGPHYVAAQLERCVKLGLDPRLS